MRESSVTSSERRQAPRTKLAEIAYIGMGPENGGLVLDVSDGGLSFHAVAPVQRAETVRFLLSLRGHSRIEGAGEVVWTNPAGTVCGLRFTSLSSGAREHLYNWVNQPPKTATVPKRSWASTQTAVASAAAAIRSQDSPVFAIAPVVRPPLSVPDSRSFAREPIFLWTAFGVVAAMLAVAAFTFGVRVGRSELGSTALPAAPVAANVEPQAAPPAPPRIAAPEIAATTEDHAAPKTSSSVSAGTPPAPKATLLNASRTEDVPGNAEQRPVSDGNSAATAEQRAELQAEAGKSELAAAQSYLNGASATHDSAKAARLLWAAVANGNSTAAALLADLYLRGDGVAKSCEQGQVLLNASAKSGNTEAVNKLKDLNANGCQ
jgi:hypothetical protein